MDSLIEELEFIALAGKPGIPGSGGHGPRRVSSIEGVHFYGQPMDSIIVPDVAEALHSAAAKLGIQPPKGGLSGPSGKDKTPSAPAAPGEAPKLKLKIKPSTLSGPQKFKVGKSDYSAPNGSKLIRPIGQPGLAYIRTPKGEVHAFNEAGEIEIPATLKTIYETKFAGDLKGDTKYAEEQFPQTSSSHSIESLSAGAILTDQQGTPQFKKLDNGDWEHLDLGVKLDEKDIKPSFDSGDLIPEKNAANDTAEKAFANTEATNFADMKPEEFKAALDGMAEGDTLDVKDSPDKPLTKMADGSWSMPGSKIKITSESLNYVKSMLSLPNGQKKEPAHKLDAQAPASPLDSKPAAKPALTKGDIPDATWIKNALPGSEATYAGDSGNTVWSKDESGSWSYKDGEGAATKITGEQFTNVAKTSHGNLTITKEGKAPTTPAEKAAPSAPAAPKAAAPSAPKAPEKKYSEGDKVSTDDLASFPEGEGVTAHYTAPVGSGTKASDSTFKKIGPNQWTDMHTSYSGFHAPDKTDEQVKKLAFAKNTELLYTKNPKEKDLSKVEKQYVETTDPNLEGAAVPNKEHTFFELKKDTTPPAPTKADNTAFWDSVESTPAPKSSFTGDTPEEFSKKLVIAHAGSKLVAEDGSVPFKKHPEGFWTKGASTKAIPHGIMYDKKDSLTLVSGKSEAPAFAPTDAQKLYGQSTQLPAGVPEGSISVSAATLDTVEVGATIHQITPDSGEVLSFVKMGPNLWQDQHVGMGYNWQTKNLTSNSATEFYLSPAPEKLKAALDHKGTRAPKLPAATPAPKVVDKSALKVGDTPTEEWIPAARAGATMSYPANATNGVPAGTWTKLEDSSWLNSESNMNYTTEDMQGLVKKWAVPSNFTVTSLKPEAAPKDGVTAPTKVGDKINNVSELEGLAPKTVMNYTQKGGKVSHYTKLDNGMWLTPGGSQMTGAQLKNGANSNKFTIGSVPETSAVSAPAAHLPGDKITKYGHLREMSIGTKLDVLNVHGAPAYSIKKHADGWHSDGMSTEDDVHAIHPDELVGLLKDTGIAYSAAPGDTNSTALDTQLWAGGPTFSKADIQEAISSMEAHSSFHVKYGFKAIPDNPLASESVQNEIKAAAAVDFPDLKSKPAFISYLKTKIGVPLTPESKKKESTGPKVNIGSKTPEAGVQGLDGGSFTEAEIQDAINILEAFKGKVFKSELNKKGNPLGSLDPNKIVGFDKDKTVTKQKLIDLLKTKLTNAAAQPAVPEEKSKALTFNEFYALNIGSVVWYDSGIGTSYSAQKTGDNEWTTETGNKIKSLTFTNAADAGLLSLVKAGEDPSTYKGKTISYDELVALPEGTRIKVDNGEGVVYTLEKSSGNDWIDSADGSAVPSKVFKYGADSGFISLEVGQVIPEAPKAKVLNQKDIPTLEIGSKIRFKSTSVDDIYTKDGAKSWTNQNGIKIKEEDLFYGADAGNVTLVHEAPKPEADHTLNESLLTQMGIGSKVYNPGTSEVLTKGGNENWSNADGSYITNSKTLALKKPRVLHETTADNTVKDMQQLVGFPTGTVLAYKYDDNLTEDYTKVGPNLWELNGSEGPDGPTTLTDSSFDSYFGDSSLTIKHLPESTDSIDTPTQILAHNETPTTMDELKAYPVGTVLHRVASSGETQVYTKIEDDKWKAEFNGLAPFNVPDAAFTTAVGTSKLKVYSYPDTTPVYAHTPAAVSEKSVDAANADSFTADHVVGADIGTVLEDSTGTIIYTKTSANTWFEYSTKLKAPTGADSSDWTIKALVAGGHVHKKVIDGPEFNKSGLVPGKYASSASANAYMVVSADGTGTYVNAKGEVSAMTVAKVKANHKAGMKTYMGMPDSIPTAPATKPVAKKKPTSAENIEDGVYFSGNPSDAKTTVYEVTGDSVKVFKPKTSTANSEAKVGANTTAVWMDNATTGAKIKNPNSWGAFGGKTYTKQDDGTWVGVEGDLLTDYQIADAKGYGPDWRVAGHGTGEPTTMTKAKLKTMFHQGKFIDSNGNSVVPEGYTGTMFYFGGQTTVPGMLAAQKKILALDETNHASLAAIQNDLKAAGLYYDVKLAKAYIDKHYPSEKTSAENTVQFFKDTLADQLKGVDTEVPDSNAAAIFDWNELGEAKMPVSVAAFSPYLYENSDYVKYIKEASASIGDGKIIGQHSAKMDKYQKSQWIGYFKAGDFKAMYALEVTAASKDGKAHNSGYLHPGYEGNAATNKIAWGAAVEGEISANVTIPGEWSSSAASMTQAEINNYLIKAQMQNPTYLSISERRSWVENHMSSNKINVDVLSATAQNRKNNGQMSTTADLVWTDDIVPAKSYDSLFDNTKFPTTPWVYAADKALDYVNDNPDNAELQAIFTEKKAQYSTYSDSVPAKYAVTEYFQGLHDAFEAEKLIPVYTKKPNQTVGASTHPVFQYNDQFGGEFFFKPRSNTKLDKYRSEVEHLGNQFGRLFGFSTSDSQLVTLDGKYGQLQKDVGGISDLMGADYSTLTSVQIADIGNEHMLDWFLDNDDSHGANAKVLQNGHIVGIDKGRAFKHFGAWKGLSGDGQMDSNAATVYNKLYTAIRSGKLDKESIDKAYLAIQKKAEKMAKVPDSKITEMLTEGMKNREQFDNSYSINGKKVPNSFDGLNAAVLDRKNKLPQEIEAMWAKIYKDAKLGDLPEKPNNPLGDVISGLDDSRLHEDIFKAEASGKTAMIGGSHVIGGTALLWTDKTSDGKTNVNGEMYLGPKKQQEFLDYLVSNATDMSSAQAQTAGFGTFDKYGTPIIAGAKTVNGHAVDGNYNESTLNTFEAAKKNVAADLAEWSPGMASNSTHMGEKSFKFSSGHNIPLQYMDQYKLMLDHYSNKADEVTAAHDTKGKVGVVSAFSPLTLSPTNLKYTKADGSSLTQLAGTDWIHADGSGGVSVVSGTSDIVPSSSDLKGWTASVPDAPEKPKATVKIVKNSSTHEKSSKLDGHTKTITGSTSGSVSGSTGQEYEITLSTGEKIYFRNSGNTNTKRGQHGKLVFRAEGVEDSSASQAAMERIMSQLGAMGIGTDAADHDNAELTYWREMYGVLENRNHKAGSKYAKAKEKLDLKVKEIGGSSDHFLENLSEKMPSEAETIFWRELYTEFWPDEVSKLIADEGYLPKFDHQNLKNPELETGKPYWDRFDITMADIYAQNVMPMSATGGEPTPMILSGGALGAEERLRQSDTFNAGWSASSDQTYGSSHNIYTRLQSVGSTSGYNAFYNPSMMLRTRAYSFDSDNYGNLANRKAGSPSSPIDAMKKFSGTGGNETMLPHMATLLDGIEVYGFDYADKRNEMIQYLKALGIEEIRGLPVEDRLVMKSNVKAAIEKVKKQWLKTH